MTENEQGRVLAIGIDAAEPALIRELIERGELPAFKRLFDEGSWSRVVSPANLGSGAVWPTFITGTEPAHHGIYGEWCWQPETMSLQRYRGNALNPFWAELDRDGTTLGLLDIPFAPVLGLEKGFEISEWGAHDSMEGRMQAFPETISHTLSEQVGPHPFAARRIDAEGPKDFEALRKLSEACFEGVKLRGRTAATLIADNRPELSIIVFPELHTASHHLWHTTAQDHPFY